MSIEKSILLEIFNKIPFTPEESNLIAGEFEQLNLKKGDRILHAGVLSSVVRIGQVDCQLDGLRRIQATARRDACRMQGRVGP